MDFKSYIRGLGAGIIIAVIICAVTAKHNNNLSEAEIRSMALEIGMTETQAFANNRTESSQDSTQAATDKSSQVTTEDNSQSSEVKTTEISENDTKESSSATEAEKPGFAETSADEETTKADSSQVEVATDGDEINVVFKNMNYAYLASAALKSAGVIDDEQAFTDYIVEHGYARKVFDGEYTFTKGMSYEEIMKVICHIK